MHRWLALIAAALICAASSAAHAERRIALVIGNDGYEALPKLQKAAADAGAYAELLRAQGFDAVMLKTNLTRSAMDQAIAVFLDTIQPGDTAVFAYSGHGWSDGVQNYIVGTDAPATGSQEFLARISIPLRNGATGVIDDMDRRGAAVKVAIIDACRDNPFTPATAGRSVGLGRGLVRIDPPKGTFVVFSASPGQTALDRLSDGDADPNSVFTRVFVPLVSQGLSLQEAVKATQSEVVKLARSVDHDQQPAYIDEMLGETCLSGDCQPATASAAAAAAPEPPPAQLPGPEMAFWTTIADSDNPEDFEAYLAQFPDGTFSRLAKIRIAALRDAPPAAAPAQQVAVAAPQAAPAEEPAAIAPAIPLDPPLDRAGVMELQQELTRVGCFASAVDGVWGQRSRRALQRFNAATGRRLPVDTASAEALAAVHDADAIVCRAEAAEPPARRAAPQRPGRQVAEPPRAPRRQAVRERAEAPRQRCVRNNVQGPAIGRSEWVIWGTNQPCRP